MKDKELTMERQAGQRNSVACKTAEAERASEKTSSTSSDVWSEFLAKIKEQCLERNFGTLSKSEFDLLVFHYYLLDKQAQVGSAYVTDYEIGRKLGLTIQRVRSLREREALKWPPKEEGRWKERFLDCLKFAHYDEKSGAVKIPVPDVNLIKEIRNYLEIAGLFDDYQLNPKVFQCNLGLFVAICLKLNLKGEDKLSGEILNKLRDSKDSNIARVVKEHERPLVTTFQKIGIKMGIKILQEIIGRFPFIGHASGEAVADYLEKLI